MASRPPLSREQRKEINIMFFHMLICIILIFLKKKIICIIQLLPLLRIQKKTHPMMYKDKILAYNKKTRNICRQESKKLKKKNLEMITSMPG